MKPAKVLGLTCAILVGVVTGSVIAQQATVQFKGVTLAQALERLYHSFGANSLAIEGSLTRQSFAIPRGKPSSMVAATAAQYRVGSSNIQGVTVVMDALPATTDRDRIGALDAWLHRQPVGRVLDSVEIRRAGDNMASRLASEIGTVPKPFSALSPDQQRTLLDIFHGDELNHRSASLSRLLSTSR